MTILENIRAALLQAAAIKKGNHAAFYKTGPGDYAAHDQFIGVPVPALRNIAKNYFHLTLDILQSLLNSPFNDERLLALLILVQQYNQASASLKENIYQFYMANLHNINNWNLVDSSAHLILGAHLAADNRQILLDLASSNVMWERRIAIVSTWHFIRNNDLEWTFKISELLLFDTHDLIHKATGWMLREAGKKEESQLINFLNKHAAHMPRTMLRYSLEKLSIEQRKFYLNHSISKLKLFVAS